MKALFVDRAGARSIWWLMAVIGEELVRRGGEVRFCRLDEGGGMDEGAAPAGVGVETIRVPGRRQALSTVAQHRAFARGFADLLRRERPDVVHTNFAVPGALARWMARRAGVPVVVTTQHELFGSMSPHLRLGVRVTERCADAVVYVSDAVARSFGREAAVATDDRAAAGGAAHEGAPGGRNRGPRHLVIHNCVDAAAIARIAAGAARVPGRIVCAGRLVPVKGQERLLRALPAIRAAEPAAHLVLIGAGPDKAHLRALAGELGIAERVAFAGWLPWEETVREMADAAAVVAPSDGTQEGFGLAVAEAMAAGAPVVASDIPVFAEVTGAEGECGRRFPPGDAGALARVVAEVLAAPEEAARRAERARTRVAERFTPERMAGAYVALYEGLLANAGAREPMKANA